MGLVDDSMAVRNSLLGVLLLTICCTVGAQSAVGQEAAPDQTQNSSPVSPNKPVQDDPVREAPMPGDPSGQIVRPVQGQVTVRFRADVVKGEFEYKARSNGLERLELNTQARELLKQLGFALVRRVDPRLERRRDGRVEVLDPAELRPGMNPERAAAFAGTRRDFVMSFDPRSSGDQLCERLLSLPAVESCRPRYGPTPMAVIPDDPDFSRQWGFNNDASAGPGQAPNFDIDAPEAWETQQGTVSNVVAVIDSGVDVRHRDLYEKIWINTHELPSGFVSDINAVSADGAPGVLTFIDINATAAASVRSAYSLTDTNGNGYIDGEDLYDRFSDGVDDDPPETAGYVDDIVGWDFSDGDPLSIGSNASHGTAVAGLVGAMSDNATDTAGVDWNVRIMPLRAGPDAWPSVQYALDRGAVVLTSSMDTWGPDDMVTATLSQIPDSDAVFSTSLGNVDRYISGTQYAESPFTIAASNFQSTGVRSFGGGSSYSANTDVAGPGAGTWTLAIPSGTRSFGGTSGANPIVAGVLSLMRAQRDGLTPEQYRTVLRSSAVDIPSVDGDQGENTPGFDYYSGWGLANADNALSTVGDTDILEAQITTQEVTYRSPRRNDLMHIIGPTAEVRAYAGDPGGGDSDIELAHADGPAGDTGGFSTVTSGPQPYRSDEAIGTLDRTAMGSGINTMRLSVSSGGATASDIGRVDVPRAYLDVEDHALITADFRARGFAFHPDFDHYEIQVAPGHGVDPDSGVWSTVGSALSMEVAPSPSGDRYTEGVLMDPVPLADLPDGEATLRVATFDSTGTRVAEFPVPVNVDKTTFPDQAGFPVRLGWPFRQSGPVAYDLTGDGQRELVVTDQRNVHVFRADGSALDGFPVALDHEIPTSPAVGDITGNGTPEIVVRAGDFSSGEDTVYVLDAQGAEVTPWPIASGTLNRHMGSYPRVDNAPVLADMDADGDMEILLAGEAASSGDEPALLVLDADGGVRLRIEPSGAVDFHGPPALGDIDADGRLEVALVTEVAGGNYELSIWNADGTNILAPMSVNVGTVHETALGDVDSDGDLEVVVLGHGAIQAYHHDGTALSGWSSISLPGGIRGSYGLSLADLDPTDADARLSALFGVHEFTDGSYRHAALVVGPDGNVDAAWSTPNWSDHLSLMAPNVFNVDGDDQHEVLIGPGEIRDGSPYVEVRAINHDNSPLTDDRFPLYFSAGLTRTPAVADLDGDGDLEYIGLANKWADSESRDLLVYDLDAADSAGAISWGMQRHDPQRTNNYHAGLRLLEPTTTRPSDVGPHDDAASRNLLLVRLRNELPHGQLTASNLTVTIGGTTAPIAAVERVEGEDWLLVAPPDQTDPGLQNLAVTWADGDIERVTRMAESVRYSEDAEPVDQVLVMDKSGSMLSDDKYLAARTAGNFYISARGNDDAAGVVAFNTVADDVIPGMENLGSDGSSGRTNVANAIDSVEPPSPGARTSIGLGIKTALEDLLPAATSDRARHLVLLSDGLENTPPFWDMGAEPVRDMFDRAEFDDVVVHTIALGDDADRDLHRRIAEHTGGIPRFVYIGHSLSIFGRLADAYKHVEETITGRQRMMTRGEDIGREEMREYSVYISPGARSAEFAISYRDPEGNVSLEIVGPDGATVSGSRVSGRSSRVVTVGAPAPGTYRVRVSPADKPTEVLTTVSVDRRESLVASLTRLVPDGESGMRGNLVAGVAGERHELRDSTTATHVAAGSVFDFLPGRSIEVEIIRPDGVHETLVLRDDGNSGDGAAGDGIFAAPVTMDLPGGYSFVVTAFGGGSEEGVERRLGYFNDRPRDVDMDDLDDAWEREHFPDLAIEQVNPLFDHDMDGLNAILEFRYETDPWYYDSDGDGRPDGQEVDAGTDPLASDPPLTSPEDSDGDGIPDDWERAHFPGSDPADVDASADPDGDDLSTFTEYELGTDPNDHDSDGNGIDDGTEAGWRLPGPMERAARIQPEDATTEPDEDWPWWWLLLLLLIVLIILVVLARRSP